MTTSSAFVGPALSLTAVVLLAGGVREQPLVRASRRPVLGLPVRPGLSLLDHWVAAVADLKADRRPSVIISTNDPTPALSDLARKAGAEVRSDLQEVRGTGGAAADIARRFGPTDLVLIANANAYLASPLEAVLAEFMLAGDPGAPARGVGSADAVVLAHQDRTPAGLMLFRAGALHDLPQRGYCDLKEQGLPQLARDHTVLVRYAAHIATHPVRTLMTYLDVVRIAQRPSAQAEGLPSWAIVEDGAKVAADARIVDSVVLAGATVGSGAVVVRSLVGSGGVVMPQTTVVDELRGPQGP